MKRVIVISPSGDRIDVTPDQVDYLLTQGFTLEGTKAVKSKVKTPKEVKDGNIQRQ